MCKAYILEAEGKYRDSLALLAKTWNSDTEINLRIRRLYFSLYYNLEEYEAGLDAVNAYRAYIKTNTDLTDILRPKYINSVYFIEKVFKIKSMPEKYNSGDIEKS